MTAPERHLHPVPTWEDDEPPEGPPPPGADTRPEVRMVTESARNVDALDAALAKQAPDLFQRGLQLVEVVAEKKPGLVAVGAPTLRPLGQHSLDLHISRHLRPVRWENATKDAIRLAGKGGPPATGSWKPTRCSPELALRPMLAYGRWQYIRPITGVVESPMLRPDGTVVQTAGYDAATGYLYRPACEYPPVPDAPTQQDARISLESLRQVFSDFPYVSEAASMVTVAALLTILSRSAIAGNVPVFAFEASQQGAGKTLQGDCVHLIATGRLAPHSSFPHDEDEQRKTILSCALSASPVAFFDNVKGVFGGEAIESAVTSGEIKQRVLGASVDMTVPWVATTLVTGNNMTMTEDMLRRSLLCRIEPPEVRSTPFEHPDLLDWVKQERARLIVAALTILRSFAYHGYPDPGGPGMPSFLSWSRLVAGAIRFAGGANVLEAVGTEEGAAGSDEAGAFAILCRELPRLSPTPVSTRAILAAVYPAPRKDEPPDGWDDLREALETLSPPRSGPAPDTQRLGMAMRARLGQVRGGKKLTATLVRGNRLWAVVDAGPCPHCGRPLDQHDPNGRACND